MRPIRIEELVSQPEKTRNSDCADVKESRGQAMVEFVLMFMLFLVIAWIPADFGLAFLTSHLAQNAAREGARIGAADPTIPQNSTTSCNVGSTCSSSDTLGLNSIKREVAERLSSALLWNGVVTVATTGTASACDAVVSVTVQGDYNYFFLGFLNYFGASMPSSLPIDRTASMRWEFQC